MWSLSKMHQVGELVAAIAVVISLVFVGLQIRDNTTATKAATYQDSTGYDIEILTLLASNPATARTWTAYVRDDPDGLTAEEREQAQYLMAANIRAFENFYLQNEAGLLSEAGWQSRELLLRNFVQMPGFEKFLSSPNGSNFGGPFMDFAKRVRDESAN